MKQSTVKELTRTDLEGMQCQAPDCHEKHGPLYFHSRCHESAPTWARYERGGLIVICCAECRAEIARIKVAA